MFIMSQVTGASPASSGFGSLLGIFFLIVVLKIISKALSQKPKKRSKSSTRPPGGGRKPYTIYYPTEKDARSFNPDGLRVFGIPGKGLNDASHFSESSIRSGIEGEVKTASIIDKFVANSTNCYAFHSLKWPMSSTEADVDHVIVCGNHMLLLDSKNWTQEGNYSFDDEGNVTLNAKKYYLGYKPKILVARQKYQKYVNKIFGGVHPGEIHSVIVIQNQKSSANRQSYEVFNHLSTGHEMEAFLRDWELSRGIVTDNKKLLRAVHSLLK